MMRAPAGQLRLPGQPNAAKAGAGPFVPAGAVELLTATGQAGGRAHLAGGNFKTFIYQTQKQPIIDFLGRPA